MFIYEKDAEDVHTLSIYKYKIVSNVTDYSYVDYDKWHVNTVDATTGEKEASYYLIIDTIYNEALIHWTYECAIYLLFFKELKQLYPKIKIHLKTQRQFKKIIYEHLKIDSEDVVLELSPNNICIFPLPISSLNKNTICPDYIAQLNAFCNYIQSSASKTADKTTSVLLMPRQTKENFYGNNRTYNTEEISTKITEIPNSMVLNTDNVKTLQEQIDLVNSSKNIILTGGSPYFFNGMMSNNANLVVLDATIHLGQINLYAKMKYSDYIVQLRNTVNNIPHSDPYRYDDIKEYLES